MCKSPPPFPSGSVATEGRVGEARKPEPSERFFGREPPTGLRVVRILLAKHQVSSGLSTEEISGLVEQIALATLQAELE